jgi:hypothetical protein
VVGRRCIAQPEDSRRGGLTDDVVKFSFFACGWRSRHDGRQLLLESNGIVTSAFFTCQPRQAFVGSHEQNQ